MSFLRRVYIFSIAFIIGFIIVLFFLNKKKSTFNYLPNARVLGELRKNKIIIPSIYKIDTLFIKRDFLNNANINFSNSQIIDEENPIYFIQNKKYSSIEYIKVKNYKKKKEYEVIEVKFKF